MKAIKRSPDRGCGAIPGYYIPGWNVWFVATSTEGRTIDPRSEGRRLTIRGDEPGMTLPIPVTVNRPHPRSSLASSLQLVVQLRGPLSSHPLD